MMVMKRKISGVEAIDAAADLLKQADDDRDDAVALVRRYVRGRLRQRTIIEAIDLLDRRADAAFRERYGLPASGDRNENQRCLNEDPPQTLVDEKS